MKTTLFILGGKVSEGKPIAHFLLRINAAIDYYHQHNATEDIVFVVSGRWVSVTEEFSLTEAEIAKRYILELVPSVQVIKEDISVEMIGNYAFSKPLITALKPDKVLIFTSSLLYKRNLAIAERIFSNDVPYELRIITDDLLDNAILVDKETNALQLFKNLFKEVADGDDVSFRNILLYSTPYYFKNIISDEDYFNTYWDGGFDHYKNGLTERKRV